MTHTSACAVHNMPAYPNGPCTCGADKEPDVLDVLSAASAGLCSEDARQYVRMLSVHDQLRAADEIRTLRAALIAAERRGQIKGLAEAKTIAEAQVTQLDSNDPFVYAWSRGADVVKDDIAARISELEKDAG